MERDDDRTSQLPKDDELWTFYKDAGFLYDSKLKAIETHRDEIRDTLRALLKPGCPVNRMFIQRDGGHIQNALNVTKYYPKTWIIHHMVSLHSPAGMMAALVDGMRWIMENPEIDFGTFYWRPNNRRSERVFRHMSALLTAERPGAHEIQASDYFFLDLAGLAKRITPDLGCPVERVDPARFDEVAGLLREALTDIQFRCHGLEAEHLALSSLDREFRDAGFRRTRAVFAARTGGEDVAFGLAEKSSVGLNFSYYFNKFQIVWVRRGLDETSRRQAFRQLVLSICSYYLAAGLPHAASMCDATASRFFQELGIRPQKQYNNMSISRPMERGVCVQAVKSYYEKRLRRLRREAAIAAPSVS